MENEVYIPEEEREKCRRVADAFSEPYELVDNIMDTDFTGTKGDADSGYTQRQSQR